MPTGQAPQALVYLFNAVPEGAGGKRLTALTIAGQADHFTMVARGRQATAAVPTSVTFFDQGLVQVLEASVTDLVPKQPYVLALSGECRWQQPTRSAVQFHGKPSWQRHCKCYRPIRQIKQEKQRRNVATWLLPGTGKTPGQVV